MEKYRQMLRQALTTDLSPNRIAAQRGMSHHTVRRWLSVARKLKLTVGRLDAMSHDELSAMFRSPPADDGRLVIPDWNNEAQQVRSGLSRAEAHADYVLRAGEGKALKYRTYCEHLREHVRKLHPVLRLEHVAGYEMQTDFSGDPVPGREPGSNAPVSFKLFVAVLPFSRLVSAHLVRTERVNDHIQANIAALEYFCGAPILARSDNLKSAVVSRPRYGAPRLQAAYQALLDHYGMGGDPARPGRPQDKAAVENSVKILQRMMKLRLRNLPLLPLEDLRRILAELVETLNNRIMRRADGHSRRTLFEAEERAHLRPLPDDRFEPYEPMVQRQVHRDYHIEFRSNYYSAPFAHIGRVATVRPSATKVEIMINGLVVAVHPRCHRQGQTITDPAHRPESHAAWADKDLLEWAKSYGDACAKLAQTELAAGQTQQKMQLRQRWIRSMPRRFGKERFQKACERAVRLGDLRFEHVENVLKRGMEAMPARSAVQRLKAPEKNIRGARYYGKDGRE